MEGKPHGFRSTFRDWAAEQTNYPRELAEAALAHVIGNKAEAAYQRGDLLEKRRKMMSAWDTINQIAVSPMSSNSGASTGDISDAFSTSAVEI